MKPMMDLDEKDVDGSICIQISGRSETRGPMKCFDFEKRALSTTVSP